MAMTLEEKIANATKAGQAAGALVEEKQTPPVTAKGLTQAGLTGIRSGAEAGVGSYGSAPGMVGGGVSWLAKKLGMSEEDAAKLAAQITYGGKAILDPRAKIEAVSRMLGFSEDTGELPTIFPTVEEVGAATDKAYPSQFDREWTRHQSQNPAEELANTTGTFAGGAFLPGGPIARAGRVLLPAAATEGAGQLARKLEPDNPELENAVRLVVSLVAAGGTGALENSFRARSAMRVINSTPGAVERVTEALRQQGQSPEEAAAAVRALGPGATKADIGPVTRQETQRIQAAGGEGRGIIDPVFRGREAGKGDRLAAATEQAVGPEVQREDVLAGLEDRRKAGGVKQRAAQQQSPVDAQGLVDKIDSQLGVEKDAGMRRMLQDIRESLHVRDQAGTVAGVLDPSSEGLLSARRAIRNKLYKPDGTMRDLGVEEAGLLQDYYAEINKLMDKASPELRMADAEISQAGKEETAFGKGEEIYKTGETSQSPVEFERTFNGMTPGEQERLLEGVNRETWKQLNISRDDLNALKSTLRGTGKWQTEKLASVIGQDKVDAFMQAIEREKTFHETYQKVIQGSKTAESMPPAKKEGGLMPDATEVGLGMVTPKAGLMAYGTRQLKQLANKLLIRNPEADNPAIARLLVSEDPEDLMQAIKLLEGSQKSIVPPAAIEGLQSRKKNRPLELTVTKGSGG